jgi:hypothetical protein
MLIAGLGFGKAIVGLTALTELLDAGVIRRALVLAPLGVAVNTWGTEPEKWEHIRNEDVAVACGTPKQRAEAYASKARIVVTNLENAEGARGHDFDALMVDELTKLKTSGGTIFKFLRKFVKSMGWRCGMTATPVAQATEDLYAQALLLDDGNALGTRKDMFMSQYFDTDFTGYNHTLKSGAVDAIASRLRGLVYKADDSGYLAALPALEEVLMPVPMSQEALDIYSVMEEDGIYGEVVAPNKAVLTGKLVQIAAGGLYGEGLVWSERRKIEALEAYVRDVGEPVLITYSYQFELDELKRVFPRAPILGSAGRATPGDIAAFNAGLVPVMLGHPKSMAMGLNLQHACRTLVHMSPLWSADLFAQSIGRVRRRGQLRDCRRVLFYSPGTVDDRIANAIREKKQIERIVMAAL